MRAFAETAVWTRVTPLVGRRLLDAVIAAKLGTPVVDYPMPTRLGG